MHMLRPVDEDGEGVLACTRANEVGNGLHHIPAQLPEGQPEAGPPHSHHAGQTTP